MQFQVNLHSSSNINKNNYTTNIISDYSQLNSNKYYAAKHRRFMLFQYTNVATNHLFFTLTCCTQCQEKTGYVLVIVMTYWWHSCILQSYSCVMWISLRVMDFFPNSYFFKNMNTFIRSDVLPGIYMLTYW